MTQRRGYSDRRGRKERFGGERLDEVRMDSLCNRMACSSSRSSNVDLWHSEWTSVGYR